MSDETIRAALEAAACALCREAKSCRGDCGGRCAWREADLNMPACAAAAAAAFLRALPNAIEGKGWHMGVVPGVWDSVADLIEEAARDGI